MRSIAACRYPPHRTARRLIDEGKISDVVEVHFYDGNRGPLWHAADKVEKTAEDVSARNRTVGFTNGIKAEAHCRLPGLWNHLGTWFLNGRKPIEVTATVDSPQGLEVDEYRRSHLKPGSQNLKPLGDLY